MILDKEKFKAYVDFFNKIDEEIYIQAIDNHASWGWMEENIPFFECPDPEMTEMYYFRWWTFRKHIKNTEDGFVITEFLPNVRWAGKHNTIGDSFGHHVYEGRWLRDKRYIKEYIDFLLQSKMGNSPYEYSTWFADAFYQFCKVHGDTRQMIDCLPELVDNFKMRIKNHQHKSGLLWSQDTPQDAMEFQVSGAGLRPTLNSYIYGDACAIARIAYLAGNMELHEEFEDFAQQLKDKVQEKLWDAKDQFFKNITVEKLEDDVTCWDFEKRDQKRNVREEIGFIPWFFNLPDPGYEKAWEQLMDPEGFWAPYGPCTTEQRHPGFGIYYTGKELVDAVKEGRCIDTAHILNERGHECLWNGPSWPFATSQTLKAMANVLNYYDQSYITKEDYYKTIKTYTHSQHITKENGSVVPYIDEDIDPYTGDWIAKMRLEADDWKNLNKGGYLRGKDYNHSTYCDHIISGLVGIQPRDDETIEIRPLIPEGVWDYFCLDHLLYHGKELTVIYDKTGEKYGKNRGLSVFVDGAELVHVDRLSAVCVKL